MPCFCSLPLIIYKDFIPMFNDFLTACQSDDNLIAIIFNDFTFGITFIGYQQCA